MIEKGEWYAFGERDNPTLKPRYIDGKKFWRDHIFTNKTKAEAHANKIRKMGDGENLARVIPLILWGKLKGYPDSIPHKKQTYVVFHHWSHQI